MGEPIASLYNLEVDPSIICIRDEIIFIYKLLWNIFEADSDKFWSIHWRGQVKVADVKSYKSRVAEKEDAADDDFNQFERACWCSNVPGVTNTVSSNGDPCLVSIFFMGPVLAHNIGVRNFFAAVAGDIFVSDDPESVSSLNKLLFRTLDPLPMPWHRRPSSFEYDWFQAFLYMG